MAQSKYKVNTTKADFAYLSEDQTRTVISASNLEGGAENLPGIAYMHNVVPTQRGLQSISYELLASPISPALPEGEEVVDVRIVYSIQRNRHYFCFTNEGNFYRLDDSISPAVWIFVPPAPELFQVGTLDDPTYNKDLLSLGRVNGVTYLYYPQNVPEPASGNAVVSYYDETSSEFVRAELDGVDWDSTIGISASSGYLIAYTQLAMAWSSTINPLDFVPSQVTGAGGGDVAGIAGNILFCAPNTLGLLFYTDNNVISATYTGNVQFPFKFREVASSKGGINYDRIAYEANTDPQYVYTKAGIQSITSREAKTILPALTDFLSGRRIETLNTETWEYERYNLGPFQDMVKKVKYVSSRYLLFSYGVDAFTHAILYDTALDKPGKLLFSHTDVFEYTGAQLEVAKDTIAMIQADGSTYLVHSATDFASQDNDVGVVVFGKLQGQRTRMMTLLAVEFEAIGELEDADCIDFASLTGARDFTAIPGVQAQNSPQQVFKKYWFKNTAVNHNIAVQGRFGLDTFIVTYTENGRR